MYSPPTPAASGASSKTERDAVARCRAKVALAKQVWNQERRSTVENNRNWLAGKFPDLIRPSSRVDGSDTSAYTVPPIQQVNTNLALRFTKDVKGEAIEEKWTLSYPMAGDLPDEIAESAADLVSKALVEAEAAREMDPGIDDIATHGNGLMWVGVDRQIVDAEATAGSSVPPSDLVLLAAAGKPVVTDGDVFVPADAEGNPIDIPRGIDLVSLSKAARDFLADEEQAVLRTLEQRENLELLARAADLMLADELEREPAGYQFGDVWVRRVTYGDDVLWDAHTFTSWRDAPWVCRFIHLTEEKARTDPALKPSARKHLKGVPLSPKDGWPRIAESSEMSSDLASELGSRVTLVEFWDREAGEVHYFTESGCYDGFLERDSKYPHLDSRKRPLFKHWYPMAVCVPQTHNKPEPSRTWGLPPIEVADPHMRAYILFDSADVASCKKAGRIVEVPSGLKDEARAALESGFDLSIVERDLALMDKAQSLVHVHSYGNAPVDFARGRAQALVATARAFDMPTPDMAGTSTEPTVGQEQMAAGGSRRARGLLVKKVEAWASDLAMLVAALVRAYYTEAKVAALMGLEFVEKPLVPGPDGSPMMGADGQPVRGPSMWDLFRTSSLLGDRIEVRFGQDSTQDLLERKADADFLAQVMTAVNPITGLPMKDPRPVLDRIARRNGFGDLKDYQPSPSDLAMLEQQAAAQAPPDGGGDGGGREAPGGGRTDGRRAGGQRGPAPVPNRQGRGRGLGDHGDQSVRAHRVGVA